ncbi:MAG: CopM family metallochaperone, partial [Stellaceae bacterium]
EKMNHDMDAAEMNGNADHDFVTMMIPHHQGAVDMAEVELKFGKDPAMRRLASDIIAAQKREIALMQTWLKRHEAR